MLPEKTIDEFLQRARAAAGDNLDSVVLYGSAVSGNFHPEFSNLNLFCVLRDTSLTHIAALHPLFKWWTEQKQPPPLIMGRRELANSADVFPIELTDMQRYHRILFGDDPIAGIQVSPQLHRAQVEYELREKLVLLRQHIALSAIDEKRLWDLLLRSAPSIVTLFRHALIVLGNSADTSGRDALHTLAAKIGFDASAIEQALEIREHSADSRKLNVNDLLSKYLAAVEQVIAAVDQPAS